MHVLTIALGALAAFSTQAAAKAKVYSVEVTPYKNNAAGTCSGTAYKSVLATTKNGCQVSTAPTSVNSSTFEVKPKGSIPGQDRCFLRFGGNTQCSFDDSDVTLNGGKASQCISGIGYDYQSFQLICTSSGG